MKKCLILFCSIYTTYAVAQTPAGNNGEIQYNSNGSFGSSPYIKASNSQLSLLDAGSTSAKILFQSESGDNSYIFSENYGANSNRLVFHTRDDGDNDYSVFRNRHWNHGEKDVFEIHRSWTMANSNFYVTDNVGIGTTTTDSKLHVKSDNYNDFMILDRTNKTEMDNLVYLTPSWDSDQNDQLRVNIGSNTIVSFEETGNVGIGTLNPSERLSVVKSSSGVISRFTSTSHGGVSGLRIQGETNDGSDVRFMDIAYDPNTDSYGFGSGSSGSVLPINSGLSKADIVVNGDGRVGIGTTSSNAKLEIKVSGDGSEVLRLSTERAWTFKQRNTGATAQLDLHSTVGDKFFNITSISGIKVARFFASSELEKNKVFLVPEGGQVGVGTTTTGTHKLAVDGTIGAREIKVELGSWSDFVFANNYKLPSLDEVEKFIAQNKHLPEIPSEAEVLEEGINLGEMNAKLLQKIEELTLYLIEQNKELKAQNERIVSLEKELKNK